MKFPNSRRFRFFAVSSLSAAALGMAVASLHMVGCSTMTTAIQQVGIPGIPTGMPFGKSGGTDNNQIAAGLMTMGKGATISDDDEDAIGQSVALEATSRYSLCRDERLTRYVTLVARTVGSVSSCNGLKWYVGILETDDVNAFSGPAGYVFITRGALRRMRDESELAGVLGHEIGHICKHHGKDAVVKSTMWGGFVTAAAGTNGRAAAFKGVADVAIKAIIINGFSVAQEKEADAEGVTYAAAAGYDPNGFLHFLQRLKEEQGGGGKPFGTHPGLDERITLVSAQIGQMGANASGKTLADRFMHNDDGTPRKF